MVCRRTLTPIMQEARRATERRVVAQSYGVNDTYWDLYYAEALLEELRKAGLMIVEMEAEE